MLISHSFFFSTPLRLSAGNKTQYAAAASAMATFAYSSSARGTFVDAHAHLFHEQFDGEGVREAIVDKVTADLAT